MAEQTTQNEAKKRYTSALRTHFATVMKLISPLTVAAELYSAEIIDQETMEKAGKEERDKNTRAFEVLSAVQKAVEANPDVFEKFCEILDKEGSTRDIAKQLRGYEMPVSQTPWHTQLSQVDKTTETVASGSRREPMCDTETNQQPVKRKKLSISMEDKATQTAQESIEISHWEKGPRLQDAWSVNNGAAAVWESHAFFRVINDAKIHAYDVDWNIWSHEIECPQADFGLAVVANLLTVVGGKVLKPGCEATNNYNYSLDNYELTNSLHCFELSHTDDGNIAISGKCLEKFPPMPTPRLHPQVTCVASGNTQYLIVVGGRGKQPSSYHLSVVEVMDTSTLQWLTPDSIPFTDYRRAKLISLTCAANHLYLSAVEERSECFLLTCPVPALIDSAKQVSTAAKVKTWQFCRNPHLRQLDSGPPSWYDCCTLTSIGKYLIGVTVECTYRQLKMSDDPELYGYHDNYYDDDSDDHDSYTGEVQLGPSVCFLHVYDPKKDSWSLISSNVIDRICTSNNQLLVIIVPTNRLIVLAEGYVNVGYVTGV